MSDPSKAFVLASNSFSGSHFINLLLERDFSVTGISRSPEYPHFMLPYSEQRKKAFTFHQLDINEQHAEIMALIDEQRPSYVVNFAAQGEVASSFRFPLDHFRTNTLGMVALSAALQKRDFIKRYVHISSPEVYGDCETPRMETPTYFNPSSPYAASKGASDLYNAVLFKNYGFPVVTIRATNVYGPHQQLYRIIPKTIICIKQGRKLQLHGGGPARKSYIHIRDVSQGELAAMLRGHAGEMYHLSPGDEAISIRKVVQTICAIMDVKFERVVEIVEERPGQDAAYILDSSKARAELSWEPRIDFEIGVREVIEWIEREWDAIKTMPLEYQHKP